MNARSRGLGLARLAAVAAPVIVATSLASSDVVGATPPPRFGSRFSIRIKQYTNVLPTFVDGQIVPAYTDEVNDQNQDAFREEWLEIFADIDNRQLMFRTLDFHMTQSVVHHNGDEAYYHQGMNSYLAQSLPDITVGKNFVIDEYNLDGSYTLSDTKFTDFPEHEVEQAQFENEWSKRPKYCKKSRVPFPMKFDFQNNISGTNLMGFNAVGGGIWEINFSDGNSVEVETDDQGQLIKYDGQTVLAFSDNVPEGIFELPAECTEAIDLDSVRDGQVVPDTVVYLQHAAWEESPEGQQRLAGLYQGARLQSNGSSEGAELQDYQQYLNGHPFNDAKPCERGDKSKCGRMWKVKEKGERMHGTLWCGWNNEFASYKSSQTLWSSGGPTKLINRGYKIYSACAGEQYKYSASSWNSGHSSWQDWIGRDFEYADEYPPTGDADVDTDWNNLDLLPSEIRNHKVVGMKVLPRSVAGRNGWVGDPGLDIFSVEWFGTRADYQALQWPNSGPFAQRLIFCRAVPRYDSTDDSDSPYAAFGYGLQSTAILRYFGQQSTTKAEIGVRNTDYEKNLELIDELPFAVDEKTITYADLSNPYSWYWLNWSDWVANNGQVIPDITFDEAKVAVTLNEMWYYKKLFRTSTSTDQTFGSKDDSFDSHASEVGGSDDKYCRHHDWCPMGNEQAEKSCFCDAIMFMYVTRRKPLQLFAPTTKLIHRACYNLERDCRHRNLRLKCTKFRWIWKRNVYGKYIVGEKAMNVMWGRSGRMDDTTAVCTALRIPGQGRSDPNDPDPNYKGVANPSIGDGVCDSIFNNDDDGYDGGDCCAETCRDPNRTFQFAPNRCGSQPPFTAGAQAKNSWLFCIWRWLFNPNNILVVNTPGKCQTFDCRQPGCVRNVRNGISSAKSAILPPSQTPFCHQASYTYVDDGHSNSLTTVWSTNQYALENASTVSSGDAQYPFQAYYCPEYVASNNGYTIDITECGPTKHTSAGSCASSCLYVSGSYVHPKYADTMQEGGYFCPDFVGGDGLTTNLSDCGVPAKLFDGYDCLTPHNAIDGEESGATTESYGSQGYPPVMPTLEVIKVANGGSVYIKKTHLKPAASSEWAVNTAGDSLDVTKAVN